MYCIVKSTPTPIIIDESRAVAASRAMPVKPIKPKRKRIDAKSGIAPIRPPFRDLKIIVSKDQDSYDGEYQRRNLSLYDRLSKISHNNGISSDSYFSRKTICQLRNPGLEFL